MKRVLLLLFFPLNFIATQISAQSDAQTIHLDAMMQITAESKASYRLILTPVKETTYLGVIRDYMDKMKAQGGYVLVGKKYLEDGHFIYYHPNGVIESEGEFAKGIKVGTWKRYDINGKSKPDRFYPAESADMLRATMQLEKDDDQK